MANLFDLEKRYSRQRLLSFMGPAGQETILNTRAVVLGAGGLGSHSAAFLTRLGVKFIRVVDKDCVDISNLHRTNLYDEQDVGQPKVLRLAEKLSRVNSATTIEPVFDEVNPKNILSLIGDADIILDGFDNLEARFLLNDAAVYLKKPWVYAACVGTTGMVFPAIPELGPCMRCIMPEPVLKNAIDTCDTVGIINVLPAFTASLQVKEAIKLLLKKIDRFTLYFFDLYESEMNRIEVKRSENCPTCSQHQYPFLHS